MEQDSKPKINPITGKPDIIPVSAITGKELISARNVGADLSLTRPTFRTADPLEKYAAYNAPLSPLFDLEEERAQRQSRAEKWGNGTTKMFTTAFGSFAEGTVGLVDGIVEALVHKDSNRLFNNTVGNAIDDMNEWMQENYPNYYTQEEQNAKGLEALGYANFWADKALNGVGYMLGTAGSVFVGSGILSLAGKGLQLGSASLRGYRVAKAISSGTEASKLLSQGSQLASRASKMGKTAYLGFTSAFAESSVEAREVLRNTEQRLVAEEAARLGVNPNSLPADVLKDIKSRSRDAANLAFGMNLVTVGTGNLILFGKIIAPKFFDVRKAGNGLTRSGKNAAWAATEFGKKDVAKKIGQGFLTEGIQEGTQFAIQARALEMADATSYSADDFGLPKMMEALFDGYAETVNSKEGLDSIMVGAIIGMLGGGVGSIRASIENKSNKAKYQKLAEALNNPDIFKFAQKAESVQAQGNILSRMQDAYDANDHKTFRDAQAQLIYEHIKMHSEAGTLDAFIERLDDENSKSADDFFSDWAVPETVTKDLTEAQKMDMKSKLVQGLKDRVQEYSDLKSKLDSRYPDQAEPTLVEKAFMSDEQKKDLLRQKLTTRAYKSALLEASLTLRDIDGRVDNLAREISELSGISITQDDISPFVKQAEKEVSDKAKAEEEGTTKDPFQEVLDKYDVREELRAKSFKELQIKLDKARAKIKESNPDQLAEFDEKAQDLQRLVEDRGSAVNALNNLQASPTEREAYMQLKLADELKAVQERLDKKVDEAIKNTSTAEQLGEEIKNLEDSEVSASALKRAKDEQIRRAGEEKAYMSNLSYNSLDELKKVDRSNLEEWKKAVLDELISDMEERGETAPRKERKATPRKERSAERTSKRSRAKSTISDALNEEEEEEGRTQGRGRKKRTGKKKESAKKREQTEIKPSAPRNDGTSTRQKNSEGQYEGQYRTIQVGRNTKILVDAQGNATISSEGLITYSSINGVDPFIEGRRLIAAGIVTSGTTVKVRPVETDHWLTEGKEYAEESNTVAQRRPIFIYVEHEGKDVAVGMLRGATPIKDKGGKITGYTMTPLRNAVHEAQLQVEENDETFPLITTTVESLGENIFSAATEDGTPYFYNPLESLGPDTAVGVVRMTRNKRLTIIADKETRTLSLGNIQNFSQEELDEMYEWALGLERSEESPLQKALPGAVVFVHRNPNGEFKLLYGHTATLSSQAQENVIELLQALSGAQDPAAAAETIRQIENLVALNKVLSTKSNAMRRFMQIDIINGVPVIGIKAVDEEGNTIMGEYVEGANSEDSTVLRIPLAVLSKVLAGEKFDTIKQALLGVESSESVSAEELNAAVKAYDNMVAVVEIDDNGLTNLRGRSAEISEEEALKIINDFPTLLRNLLAVKKYNIDADQLYSSPSYLEQLLEEDPSSVDTGFKGRIGVSAKAVDGNVSIDTGLNFADTFEVDGKEVSNKVAPRKQAESAAPKNKPVVKKRTSEKEKKKPAKLDTEDLIEHKGSFYEVTATEEGIEVKNAKTGKVLSNNSSIAKAVLATYDEQSKETLKGATRGGELEGKDDAKVVEEVDSDTTKTKKAKKKGADKKQSAAEKSASRVAKRSGFGKRGGPLRAAPQSDSKLNVEEAKAWLSARGIDVSVFDSMQTVGNSTVHGYVQGAMVHLWASAEVGTEYHEAFHVVFRSMLNDKQRAVLYAEEKALGAASQIEVKNILEQFPALSITEAENLVYEERMAEKFRNYVITEGELGKTLGGKIRKFFRDLWNYMKAILGFPVGVRNLFSLIESNRIPKKFVRNAKFLDGTAYRVVEGFEEDPDLHERLSSMAATVAINMIVPRLDGMIQDKTTSEERSIIVDEVLGVVGKNDMGAVGRYFLQNALHIDSDNRLPISSKLLRRIEEIISRRKEFASEEEYQNAIADFMKENNIKVGLPITDALQTGLLVKNSTDQNSEDYMVLKDDEELENLGYLFVEIATKWEGTTDEFGNKKSGFRDQVIDKMTPAGFNVKVGKVLESEEYNENDVLAEDEHEKQDKYYFAEQIEFDVKEKMGDKLRQLIASLQSTEPNEFGFREFLSVNEVYRQLVAAVVDSADLTDMMNKLEDKVAAFPELKAVYHYLVDEATPEQLAIFKSYCSLGYADQRFVIEEKVEEGEETGGVQIKLTNADVKTAVKGIYRDWKVAAIQTNRKKENAILILKYDEVGKVSSREVNNNTEEGLTRAERLNTAHSLLSEGLNEFARSPKGLKKSAYKLEVNNYFNAIVEGLAISAWEMGLPFGVSKEDAAMKVKSYLLNSVRAEDRFNEINRLADALDTLIKTTFEVIQTSDGRITSVEGPRTKPQDFFATETTSVTILAEALSSFRPPKATSIVDPTGRTLYLYNTRSQLNRLVRDLNNPNSKFLNKLSKDEFIAGLPGLPEETASALYTELKSGRTSLEVFSMNSIKDVHGNVVPYKKMSPRDSLITRLNLYINDGLKDGYFAISVQETRSRIDFVKMRKLSKDKSKSRRDHIFSILMRDLHRINQDPALREALESGKKSPADVFVFGKYTSDFVITEEQSKRFKGLRVSQITHLLDENDTKILDAVREEASKIETEVIPMIRKDIIDELEQKRVAVDIDNALKLNFPNNIRDRINAGEITVIQGRKEDIASTERVSRPLRIGDKYYYAQYAMDKQATFAEFAAAYGGREKALKILGVDSVQTAPESLKSFLAGKKSLTLYTLQEVSKEEAGVEEGVRLNRINDVWKNKYSSLEDMLDSYIFDDFMARSEMVAIFRGGIGQAKNLTDVYKRMGLLNTPGTEMLIEGEIAQLQAEEFISRELQDEDSPLSLRIEEIRSQFAGKTREEKILEAKLEAVQDYIDNMDPEARSYGMLKEVNTVTVAKFELQEAIHDTLADQYVALIKQDVNVTYTEEEINKIRDQYKRNLVKKDITDGISLISPIMAKKLREGQGKDAARNKWREFVESGYRVSNLGYSEPYKPFMGDLNLREVTSTDPTTGKERTSMVLKPDLQKNSYMELRPELVAGNPVLQELYDRMMAIGKYEGLDPIHLINTESAQKGDKTGLVNLDARTDSNGELLNPNFAGALTNTSIYKVDGSSFILPQSISETNNKYTRFNRQIRKDSIVGLSFEEMYDLGGENYTGEEVFNLYQKSIRELMRKAQAKVDARLGIDKLLQEDSLENRINFYKKVKQYFIEQKIERGELDDNMEEQLELIADGFRMPINTPGYQDAFENLITAVYKKEVLKISLPGKELVQDPGIGPVVKDEKTGKMRELRFLSVTEGPNGRIGHAECLIGYDVAKRYGIEPGDDISKLPEELRELIGYRVPHQGKSSTLILKVVGFLPEGYSKTILVPGNITVQMGSDFDIDKMFVLMREAIDGVKIAETFDEENISGASMESIRNTLFEIISSISSDPKHAGETLAPLDTELLENIVTNILGKSIDTEYFFAHPLVELDMERKFKMAQQLVGVYANGIAGASVAVYGKLGTKRGLKIHNSKAITFLDENNEPTLLDTIGTVSPLTGKSIFYGIVKRLSAALDAGTTPLQDALNDNLTTANAIIFLESVGLDEESISLLMNNPLVREFVEHKDNSKGTLMGSTYRVLKEMDETYADYYLAAREYKDVGPKNSKILKRSDLLSIYNQGQQGIITKKAQKHFRIFISAFVAGEHLSDVYRAITPDVLDSMGDFATMESYMDSQRRAANLSGEYIVDQSQINQFIYGDAYEMQASYMDAFDHIQNVLGQLFSAPHVGIRGVKQAIKNFTGNQVLTPNEHRMLNRAAYWASVSRPVYNKAGEDINPLAGLLSADRIKGLYTEDKNLWERVVKLKEKNPVLAENEFIKMIEENENNDDPKNRLYRVQLNTMEKMDTPTRNRLIRAFAQLLYEPAFFVNEDAKNPEKSAKKIKKLAEDLVINSIVSTGMAPGYGSYQRFIPLSFFAELAGKDPNYTLRDHLMSEFNSTKLHGDSLLDMVPQIISNYGHRVNEYGQALVRQDLRSVVDMDESGQIASVEVVDESLFKVSDSITAYTPEGYVRNEDNTIRSKSRKAKSSDLPLIVRDSNRYSEYDKSELFVLTKYGYVEVRPMGLTNQLIEINLRDENGKILTESIIPKRGNEAPALSYKLMHNPVLQNNLVVDSQTGEVQQYSKDC